MLDNLLEIEVAYRLLKSGGDEAKDPIDVNYEKLKTNVDVSIAEMMRVKDLLKSKNYLILHAPRIDSQPWCFSVHPRFSPTQRIAAILL